MITSKKLIVFTLVFAMFISGFGMFLYGNQSFAKNNDKTKEKIKTKIIGVLSVGDEYKLKHKKGLKYKSSDKKIATVSKKGKIVVRGYGNCIIKVRKNGKLTKKYKVICRRPSVIVTPTQIPSAKPVITLSPSVKPENTPKPTKKPETKPTRTPYPSPRPTAIIWSDLNEGMPEYDPGKIIIKFYEPTSIEDIVSLLGDVEVENIVEYSNNTNLLYEITLVSKSNYTLDLTIASLVNNDKVEYANKIKLAYPL